MSGAASTTCPQRHSFMSSVVRAHAPRMKPTEKSSTNGRLYPVCCATRPSETLRYVVRLFHHAPEVIDIGSHLQTTIFGVKYPSPLLIAPIGVQGIVHPDAELASARAAAKLGVPIVMSTAATRSIEAIAEANGSGHRWYQLYWWASFRSPTEGNTNIESGSTGPKHERSRCR